jgi:unsaturated rhamnogalacturonyl hydrolase
MTLFGSPFVRLKPFRFLLAASLLCSASAQTSKPQRLYEKIVADAGNTPKDPGPQATGLSSALTHKQIQQAMKLVADWQIQQAATKVNQDWTYAPLYLGLLATSTTTGDAKYHDFVLATAQSFQWKLWADRPFHADDEAIGQTYESLYQEHPDPLRIADTKATFDALLKRPDDPNPAPNKDLWWWCDALFMAPAGLARMSAITGDHAYIDTMNREWDLTQAHLYDPAEHLFSRDASFLHKREANGSKLFWSRGNAWVLAGTVNVLRVLPKDDPSRPKYVALFLEMSRRIASLQQPDGLWRAGLLDEPAYPLPEVSGSAFFTYAMTWGINEGILDRVTYGPIVEHAWSGMLQHIYADGRLGSIQPIGASPDTFSPQSSYVYGVGAFLLAGSELNRYAKH